MEVSVILNHKGAEVFSISPDATVFEAIQRMAEKNVGALVVMSGETLEGLVSERDYTRKVILQGRSSRDTQVHEIMTSPVTFVTPSHTVEECMRLMTDRRVRHLPVLDGDRVAGVLSIGDLVNWIISAQRQTIDHLHNYIAGAYPA